MIEIRLTPTQAIALEQFLANRLLLSSRQFPSTAKEELICQQYSSEVLDQCQEKIHSELDSRLRQQQEVMSGA